MVGRCSPASNPASRPAIPTATLPCNGDGLPTPTSVPGRAVASTRTAAPAGGWDDVRDTERAEGRAQEGMGEDRGRTEEAAGEGGKGHGRGEQGGRGVDGRARRAARRGGAGSGGAAASVGQSLEKAGEGGEGGTGRRAARDWRGAGGLPPTFRQPAILPEQESEMQEREWRWIRGEAAWLAEVDREVAAREEEEAVASGAHLVRPDPEQDTPSTDVEGRSPSGKRAREEGGEARQEWGRCDRPAPA